METQFIERELIGNEPPRCVDGRRDSQSKLGPQMLGGSLHPVLLNTITSGKTLDKETVIKLATELKQKGFYLGVHRGAHQNSDENKSDCGAGDRTKDIILKAISQKVEITKRLSPAIEANTELGTIGDLEEAYSVLKKFDSEKILTSGEELIATFEEVGASVETLSGDHNESVAFVNTRTGSTLDTIKLNEQGKQGFNLDLDAAVIQSEALGVNAGIARALSLILYQATEMVLVEDKDKQALPVIIHK